MSLVYHFLSGTKSYPHFKEKYQTWLKSHN